MPSMTSAVWAAFSGRACERKKKRRFGQAGIQQEANYGVHHESEQEPECLCGSKTTQ
jgi:hypothetical protein